MTPDDIHLVESAIGELLNARADGATICPSEAARHVAPDDWRDHMEMTRQVAREMARSGTIEICQSGVALDPDDEFRGPIRLRWKRDD